MFYDRQTLAEEIKKLIKDKKRRKDSPDNKKPLDCYGITPCECSTHSKGKVDIKN